MKTALDAYRNSMTHEELQNDVIELAHSLGWRVAGFHKAMCKDGTWMTPVLADSSGWPDLFLANEAQKRVIAIEIKTIKDTVKPAQQLWIARLVICGIPTYVVRPQDWHSGAVDRMLGCQRPHPYQEESID
jgi:hypothetical protein